MLTPAERSSTSRRSVTVPPSTRDRWLGDLRRSAAPRSGPYRAARLPRPARQPPSQSMPAVDRIPTNERLGDPRPHGPTAGTPRGTTGLLAYSRRGAARRRDCAPRPADRAERRIGARAVRLWRWLPPRLQRGDVGAGDTAVDEGRRCGDERKSSLARKVTAAATSSGSAKYPSHVHEPSGGPLGILAEQLAQQRRVNRAGAPRVESDAVAGDLCAELARHRQHPALGRRIGDLRGRTRPGHPRPGGRVGAAAPAAVMPAPSSRLVTGRRRPQAPCPPATARGAASRGPGG
jgi:hypothetical protein